MFCRPTDKKPWKKETDGDFTIWSAGVFNHKQEVLTLLKSGKITQGSLGEILKKEYLNFGLIIEGNGTCLALVDRTQSYPVFYDTGAKTVSFKAQDLSPKKDENVNDDNLLIFTMAGYVIGEETFIKNISQLLAGQYLFFSDKSVEITHYYRYRPAPQSNSEENLVRDLGQVMDETIERCLESCKDKQICVPLSGGLDSRFLAAKFHEHGVKDLVTFSYGLPGNYEAKKAEEVAKQLGVPWTMLPSRPQDASALFQSEKRKAYEDYAHGYSFIPSYVEYEAIDALDRSGLISKDTILINGQSGDYITGGHIPTAIYESKNPCLDDVLNFAVEKHFSLWTNIKTPENVALVTSKIKDRLLLDCNKQKFTLEELVSAYETFEWEERQSKMVVHANKCYDFFGYDWRLPLWDKALMDFFEKVPFDQKYKQKLYKTYLQDYNYKGVFTTLSAQPVLWRTDQMGIILMARLIGLIKGKSAKADFYKKKFYYGDQHYQYALFGKEMYDANYKNIRNMISLSILDFMQSQNLKFPAA